MGFEGRKVLRLKFEDSDLEGLEVVTRYPTIDEVTALTVDEDAPADESLRRIAELLCSVLISWNLENDGVPVNATVDELLAQDYDVAKGIIRAWEDATFKVAPPLPEGSSAGEPFPEASIPMVALLPSQAS